MVFGKNHGKRRVEEAAQNKQRKKELFEQGSLDYHF